MSRSSSSHPRPASSSPEAADAAPEAEALPIVALVGRPNVGKSTLFNRLTRSRQALVATVPGTTRDRREGEVHDRGYRFRLVDTGGMSFGMAMEFSAEVEAQIAAAVAGADYVWLVMDGKEGLNPYDVELHRWVEQQGRPWSVLVNKVDNAVRRADLVEFYALGTERLHGVSATHGLGLDAVLEETARELPALRAGQPPTEVLAEEPSAHPPPEGESPEPQAADGPLRVAFLGRPNVGKSSLVNRVLGSARMIVAETAGTTREAVETGFALYGRDYVLVDTAGIRRRSRTQGHLEKIGVLHSLGALNWVQVAVLVVDATDEVAAQDQRIARYILEHRRAVVVALNKWDRVAGDRNRARAVEAAARDKLRFLDFAAFVRTSALEGSGMQALFREVQRAAGQFSRQVQTADLNRMVQAAGQRFPPPAQGGVPTRIHYGTQVGTQPPAFRFFTNHPRQMDEAYTRFFERQLRHHFGFRGTPLRIDWRGKRTDRAPPGRSDPAARKRAHAPRKRASRR